MCEACDDPQLAWEETEPVAPGEDWLCDEEDCAEPAAWCTRFATVDEHVCDAHKGPDEPGLQGLLSSTGLSDGSYFLAIRKPASCEGALVGPGCRARATWAHVLLARTYACEDHRASDSTPRDSREVTA